MIILKRERKRGASPSRILARVLKFLFLLREPEPLIAERGTNKEGGGEKRITPPQRATKRKTENDKPSAAEGFRLARRRGRDCTAILEKIAIGEPPPRVACERGRGRRQQFLSGGWVAMELGFC